MRSCLFFSRLLLVFLSSFGVTVTTRTAFADTAVPPSAVISEVQIAGDKADDEFVEITNTTNTVLNLNGWKIRKRIVDLKTNTSAEVSVIDLSLLNDPSLNVPPKGTLLWANSKGVFATATLPQFTTGNSFTNDATNPTSIAIFDKNNTLIDSITWGANHPNPFMPSIFYPSNPSKNTSLERDLLTYLLFLQAIPNPSNTATIHEKVPTENPVELTDPSAPATENFSSSTSIRINELLPNPSDREEFIELFNESDTDLDLFGWMLRDASKTGVYTFPAKSVIKAQSSLVITKDTFAFALNNTNESISLFDPTGTLIDALAYTKSSKDASYNFVSKGVFRWSGIATPSAENQFTDAPNAKVSLPKTLYKGLSETFTATLLHSDNTTVLWDFGDGHESRLDKATHIYTKTGRYRITLTLSNSIETTTRSFAITVKKFPSQKLSIVAINPNPIGDDTHQETITLLNPSKKKINLKGWSIATGTNKSHLVNHSITINTWVNPAQSITLSDSTLSLNLPNKQGFIEIRKPDKKPLDRVTYTSPATLSEGSVYQQSDANQWVWKVPEKSATENALKTTEVKALSENPAQENTNESIQTIIKTHQLLDHIDTLSPTDLALLAQHIDTKLKLDATAQDTSSLSPSATKEEVMHEESANENESDTTSTVPASHDSFPPVSTLNQKLTQLINRFVSRH
jgi:PKD repeat protein